MPGGVRERVYDIRRMPERWHRDLHVALMYNTIDTVCENFSCNRKQVKKSLERYHFRDIDTSLGVNFGHKNEAYFTEEEMLNGFSVKYEDLSQEEKKIYNGI